MCTMNCCNTSIYVGYSVLGFKTKHSNLFPALASFWIALIFLGNKLIVHTKAANFLQGVGQLGASV